MKYRLILTAVLVAVLAFAAMLVTDSSQPPAAPTAQPSAGAPNFNL